VVYPFRGHVGAVAVAMQIAGGAAVYGTILLGCNFLGLRDSIVQKYFSGGTSDVTGPAIQTAANVRLADAQLR
jgi:hypothetical protein